MQKILVAFIFKNNLLFKNVFKLNKNGNLNKPKKESEIYLKIRQQNKKEEGKEVSIFMYSL